jgi:hypothetical protein
MMASSAAQASALVRDPSHFQWYVIPLLLLVLYVYGEQAAERRWHVVLGGLAFWLMDWFNEIGNGLLLHFSGYAPAWSTPAGSAYVILVGLNIEISLMFAVMGVVAMRMLPVDPHVRWLGLPNRWLMAAGSSVLCVLVEYALNAVGALRWEWAGWNVGAPWLIWLIGYVPFFAVGYWVHDMPSTRRQLQVVASLATAALLAMVLFAGVLHWV